MLRRVTDYVLALLELLEAEVRSFKSGLVRTGTTLSMVVVGMLLLGAAAAVLGWAAYLALVPLLGRPGAAACCALALAIFGVIFLWTASSRRSKN